MRSLQKYADSGCTDCRLHKNDGETCWLGEGYSNFDAPKKKRCDVMVINESPEFGEPSRGRELLDGILEEQGITEYYYANAVSCQAISHKAPTKGEVKKCSRWLALQLRQVKPKYVLLLGNVPLIAITGAPGIRKRRGRAIEQDGRIYLPTYHPNYILRDNKHRSVLETDIRLFAEIIANKGVPKEGGLNYTIVRDPGQFEEMLKDISGTISFDVETTGLYPWCTTIELPPNPLYPKVARQKGVVSLGIGTRRRQWCLPLAHPGAPKWPNLSPMMKRLDKRIKECVVAAQFGKFDTLWMWVMHQVKWYVDFDTGLAHYLVNENSVHGLKFLAQLYFGAPDFDESLKLKTGEEGTLEEHCHYLAHDLYYTRKLRFKLGKQLNEDEGVKRVFEKIMMPCSQMFTDIEHHGVYVRKKMFQRVERKLRRDIKKYEKELSKYGPKDINWRSTPQVCKLLYEDLKLPVMEKTKTGNPSAGESALNQIDHPLVKALLNYRGANQQLSFFIEGWKPYLVDSRLHPSFKLHGAVTGRPSCIRRGTEIMVPGGTKPIEQIRKGDWVYCFDDGGKLTLRQVRWRRKTGIKPIHRLHWIGTGGRHSGYLDATADHRIRPVFGGYRRVDELDGGDYILALCRSPDASHEVLESYHMIQRVENLEVMDEVHDMEVEDTHNFIANELCVHNCEHPNLQQVPRDSLIRSLISAPPGWVLVDGDLSQIELRVAGELSGDPQLLKVFHEGGDAHWQTAIREISRAGAMPELVKRTARKFRGKKFSYSAAIELLYAMGPDAAIGIDVAWKELRKKAKATNFGYLYGMWWKKFKQYARDNYGVILTDEEAEASREAYFALYSRLPAWHAKQKRFARRNGYVRCLTGRLRRLPAAMSPYDTFERGEAERQAINSPVQGFASELNLMVALQLYREFSYDVFRPVGTIHDSVLAEVKKTHLKKICRRWLEIMKGPAMLKDFEIELEVPICGDLAIGPWSKGVEFK